MKRFAMVVGLLGIVGCGVGPGPDATLDNIVVGGAPMCLWVDTEAPRLFSSSTNPWGPNVGVVVAYVQNPSIPSYVVLGVDLPFTHVIWWMRDASAADLAAFEAYPQSMRDCLDGQGNPGTGASPKGTPDPQTLVGVCVPTTVAADTDNAYEFNWDGGGTGGLCRFVGPGGCVPWTCADYGPTCGYQGNGCGGTIYCGACRYCPCGGTYPRCRVCSF